MDQEKIDAFNAEQQRLADEQAVKNELRQNAESISKNVTNSGSAVVGAVAQSGAKTEQATKEVSQTVSTAGQSIVDAVTSSQNEVATALNNLVVATVVSKDPQLIQAAKDVATLLSSIAKAGNDFKGSKLNLLPVANEKLATSIDKLASSVQETPDKDYTKQLDNIAEQLRKLDVKPVINIPEDKEVDLSPLLEAIQELKKAVTDSAIELPENDDTAIVEALKAVQRSIDGQVFPVPNYVLPFKDASGKATQVQLDSSGNMPISLSSLSDVTVQGDVASGVTDSGNPIKLGGIASTSTQAAVTDGQRVNAEFSKTGKQVVIGALREQLTNQQTTITSSTGETTIVTADATYFLDLYGLILTNTSATVTKVTIKDDTAGTTRMVFEVPATDTRGFMLPVDAGHKQAVVNKPWTVTCGTSVASLEVTALVNKRL